MIKVNNFNIGQGQPLTVIAGPCQIETLEHALMIARTVKEITDRLGMNFVYKSSFDKANRTSIHTKRGVGLIEGLKILRSVKNEINVPILTDIHHPEQAKQC